VGCTSKSGAKGSRPPMVAALSLRAEGAAGLVGWDPTHFHMGRGEVTRFYIEYPLVN